MSILKGLKYFGIQGFIDQATGHMVTGAFKGAFGFTSNFVKGVAGADYVSSATKLGSITGKMGYTAGRATAAPFKSFSKSSVAKGVAGASGDFFSRTVDDLGNASKRAVDRYFIKDAEKFKDMGVGLNGYRLKSRYAWGLGLGAIALGTMDGVASHDMNYGLKFAINGIMDYDAVAVSPGSVNNSYTPVYNRPNKRVGSGGVEGLGFALHNARNTGYL